MVIATAGELAAVLVSLLDELALVFGGPLDDIGLVFSNALGIVGHPVRKKVLTLLAENQPLTRSEIAKEAATDEDVPCESVDRLELVLHHNHLPRLEDHQYIEYDTRNGDVVLWEDSETVESLLNAK